MPALPNVSGFLRYKAVELNPEKQMICNISVPAHSDREPNKLLALAVLPGATTGLNKHSLENITRVLKGSKEQVESLLRPKGLTSQKAFFDFFTSLADLGRNGN